jgi:uncharacterized membrane protein YfcA
MDVGPLRDVLTVLLGLLTGALSGLFGVGGAVVSQPGMRLLGLKPLLVIGTALPVIIPGAASGARRYAEEHLIRWPAVVATVPAGIMAAIVGGVAADHVPGGGHLLQLATAGLLALSAWRIGRAPAQLPPDEPRAETDAPDAPDPVDAPAARGELRSPEGVLGRYAAIGAVSGGLSGLLGIGGGVILVPAFVRLARMEVKAAIATSLVCVGCFAVPGTITHALLGDVDWRVAAALIVGVVPGARLGASLTVRLADGRLRVTVAVFLAAVAVIYAAGELNSLL